ncbi:unnamed protein product [Moneuplotes crassus]|uniref:DUF726 domain-containing protein n=1 Tax=Euplotes crassus TaxID=5936 RepID=A0AAD1XGM8_EUPCR|nr:unnamed protein product [Moneuplotes crassus]
MEKYYGRLKRLGEDIVKFAFKNEEEMEEPDITEHRFDDFLEELNELGDLKEYKKLSHKKEINISKKKLLKKAMKALDPEYVEKVTLDEIERDVEWNKRITICINGYMSDNAANGNWNPAITSRPNDLIYVYHFPTIVALMEDEKVQLSDFFQFKAKKIWKMLAKETNKFTAAVELAQKSGALLAYLICLDFPQKYKKVDLIGFSLGTQVIKSCLETLKKLNVTSIIDNVYFMGGATWLNISDVDIFDTVNTSVNHSYTKRDHTLTLYEYHQIYFGKKSKEELKEESKEEEKENDEDSDSDEPQLKQKTKKKPIGRSKLNEEIVIALEAKGLKVNQSKVSDIVGEHLFYWKYLDEILERMDFGDVQSETDSESD